MRESNKADWECNKSDRVLRRRRNAGEAVVRWCPLHMFVHFPRLQDMFDNVEKRVLTDETSCCSRVDEKSMSLTSLHCGEDAKVACEDACQVIEKQDSVGGRRRRCGACRRWC